MRVAQLVCQRVCTHRRSNDEFRLEKKNEEKNFDESADYRISGHIKKMHGIFSD